MLDWIVENWDNLFIAISAVIAAGIAVAALTPTTKDDSFWAKVKSIFDKLNPLINSQKENVKAYVESKKAKSK